MIEYLKGTASMKALVFASNNRSRPNVLKEFTYTSIEDYILDRGRPMESIEALTEEQYEYLIDAAIIDNDFMPKECFANAMALAMNDADDRISYVEGYAFTGLFPVHHAWALLDGKIVDVTRSLRKEATEEFLAGKKPQKDLRDRVLGAVPDGWEYFGVEFSLENVCDYCEAHEEGIDSILDDPEREYPFFKAPRLKKKQYLEIETSHE